MGAKKEDILKKLEESVKNADEEAVKAAAQEALDAGIDLFKAIYDGLAAGLRAVGELYEKEYFAADLLVSADTFYEGFNIFKPHLHIKDMEKRRKGVVVIGVVEGDIHDIGKNFVKYLLEAEGFEVYDLGYSVTAESFIEEAVKTNADIIALSALMTSTMLEVKKIIGIVRERNMDVKVLVGGSPITKEVAELFGADGWGLTAPEGAKKALELVKKG